MIVKSRSFLSAMLTQQTDVIIKPIHSDPRQIGQERRRCRGNFVTLPKIMLQMLNAPRPCIQAAGVLRRESNPAHPDPGWPEQSTFLLW